MLKRQFDKPSPILPLPWSVQQGEIPDTWPDVTAFARWYTANHMPAMVPVGAEIFLSDDATAVCLFRKGQFQVEMYLIHPGPILQMHEHPGVEVIKYYGGDVQHVDGGRWVKDKPITASPVLLAGEAHGVDGDSNSPKGFVLWAFQHWADGLTPTTVAARWKGKTVGPMQEALIRRFYPDALVVRGYADVTQKAYPKIPVSEL